jgi:ectoine hydroxylase-related dioxygenase (phytanoyl-CoA dioxygenase family)
LGGVLILYSPNTSEGLSVSQKFHVDPEGTRQVKLFMAIREVTKHNGPFTFVPKSLSRKMLDSGDSRFQVTRVQDDHIMEYAPQHEWVAHVGKPGDAVFVDTSGCFHFGSRQSKQPRYLLYVQYHDPFSSMFPVVDPFKNLRMLWQQYPREAAIFPDYVLARKL